MSLSCVNSCVLLLLITWIESVNSALYLYEETNFKRFMGKFEPSDECTNLNSFGFGKAASLKTDDCLMIYDSPDCLTGFFYVQLFDFYFMSLKVPAGEYETAGNIAGADEMRADFVYSFKKCSRELGGAETQLAIYKDEEIISHYKTLCGRIEIPSYAQYPTKFNNYGNCVTIEYKERSGSVQTRDYAGGERALSLNFNVKAPDMRQLLAISPCHEADYCTTLNATVTKFEVIDQDMSIIAKSSDMSMAATTTFINDGWATVSQEYTATKTVTEATEISYVKSFSKMNNWNVAAGIETKFTSGVPFMAQNEITISLSTSYMCEETESVEVGHTERREVSTEFSVNQGIEIEPCTKCKVDSFIKMTKAYSLIYNVTYEVSGRNGERMLNTLEIRNKLGSLSYIIDKNNETVVASDLGAIFVDFGVESVIDGEGEVIENCVNNSKRISPKLLMQKWLHYA